MLDLFIVHVAEDGHSLVSVMGSLFGSRDTLPNLFVFISVLRSRLFQSAVIYRQQETEIFINRHSYIIAHILPFLKIVRHVLQLFIVIVASVRCFNCVGQGNAYLPEDYRTSCGLLEFADPENARVVAKHRCQISQQFRKQSCLVVEPVDNRKLRTINESILFGRVPVKIQEHQ
jgi:hypothetical protein